MEDSQKKSGMGSTLLLFVIFLFGLGLLVYPTFSNYWNSMHTLHVLANYEENVSSFDREAYQAVLDEANEYNASISSRDNYFEPSEEELERYNHALNLLGDGTMGYIEIASIDVRLPVAHGTEDTTLYSNAGHVDWSALPIGGEGTHSVISGHRGLPTAKLFTRLDEVREGDVFVLRIMDEVLTYEVDQIRIVEPTDTSALLPEEGKDLCTLVTCTPYGINSHRMLVRGHRIENAREAQNIRITADALQIEPLIVAPVLAIPLLILLMILVFVTSGNKAGHSR